MSTVLHRFVEKIVRQTDGNKAEKKDLYEELMSHLESSCNKFLAEGFERQGAEQKAMECFGDAGDVGGQIQQAMFPFRKEMMLTLAIVSIVFSFAVYLAQLFIEGDAYIGWLILSIIVSTFVFIFAVHPLPFLNRRLALNSMLFIHIFTYLFGVLLATGVTQSISIVLTFMAWFIVLLGIVLVYRTTIYDYQSSKHPYKRSAILLHTYNLTIGMVIIGFTLFFLWAFMLFIDEWTPFLLLLLVPLLIWLIAYMTQMKLLGKGRKSMSYVVALAPLLLLIVIALWLFMPIR